MSNQYFNFYYDPVRQGYDPVSWRSLTGTPLIAGNQLSFNNATAVHLADILRGDASFSLNLAAPANGDQKQFGFMLFSKNEYLTFNIFDSVFSANSSDGTTSYSIPITWQSAWTNTNTEFRIQWEAGLASFYVGGVLQAVISTTYTLDIPVSAIPGDPMSLYVSDFSSSANHILVNYIDVKSIQSYILSTSAGSGASFPVLVDKSDKVTISENITMLVPTIFFNNGVVFDTLTTSESITMFTNKLYVNGAQILPQNVTITESVTVGTPA